MAAGNAPQVAQSLAVGFDDLFMPVFRELIPPSIDEITLNKVRVQAIMSNMVNNAPNLSTELAGSLNLNSLYGGYGAGIFTQYVMDYGSRDFISIFSAQKKDSTELNNFISSIIADNSIINAGWFNLHNGASLLTADAVSKIADRTDASLFFQDWLIQKNKRWLEENSGLEERLNVVFQVDKPVFLTRYLDELGVGNVNRAIERIPQMTTAVYLDLVWEAVLHNTLNPTYRPPQVNTPDAGNIENDTIYLAEHHLYGSSRLGIKTYDKVQYRSVYQRPVGSTTPGTITENTLATQVPWYSGGFADWIQKDKTVLYTGSTYNLSLDSFYNVRTLGAKQYELTDHLGNVLVTVLDKKTGYGSVGGLYKGYWANLASVTDYYPFGMEMPGRNKQYSFYRSGFNGKEKDDEIYGKGNFQDYGERNYDPRIARLNWRVDPLTEKFPWYTPYQFAGNNPIKFIDLDGTEPASPEAGKKNLLLIIQGWGGTSPENGKTQVKNSPQFADPYGLGSLESLKDTYKDLQITIFAPGGESENDANKTILDFRKANPTAHIITVGHSLGANELVNITQRNNAKAGLIDLFISIDAQGREGWNGAGTKTEVGNAVWGTIAYYEGSGRFQLGGNKLNFISSGINKEVKGVSHTSIDNVLSLFDQNGQLSRDNSILIQDIKNELNFRKNEPVDLAKSRILSNMSKASQQVGD